MNEPLDLKLLSGKVVSKYVNSIQSLNIPIECESFLGLIEIQEFIPFVTFQNKCHRIIISSEFGGRIIDSKEYLDIDHTEHLTGKSFRNLIESQHSKKLPYILAITTCRENDVIYHTYYDAHFLNRYLELDIFDTYYNIDISKRDPLLKFPLLNEVKYFIINSIYDQKMTFLSTNFDFEKVITNGDNLIELPFIHHFFNSNKNLPRFQNLLAILYHRMGNNNFAKHYFYLAEQHGHCNYNNLGLVYEKENNFEKAIHYYMLYYHKKDNLLSKYNLGRLHEKLGNLTESQKYYSEFLSSYEQLCPIKVKKISIDDDHNFFIMGLYHESISCPYNAIIYYQMSAFRGNVSAYYRLGLLSAKNKYDNTKSYFETAAKNGHVLAQKELDKLMQSE